MKRFGRTRLKREMKRRPINVLASAITTFSLYLGLVSITYSIREDYERAAYFILAAIICDMLDGTIARLTKSTSEFGKELDSLCDLVSFGVAPAILIYHSYLYEEQLAKTVEGTTGTIMAIIFVICGALRLARFNVFQSGQRESFTGLPIPAAGATVATFVLFTRDFELRVASWILGPMTLVLAYLMVSTVRYPKDRLKRLFVANPRNAFRMLALLVVAFPVVHLAFKYSSAIVLFPLCMTYVVFGIADTIYGGVRGHRALPVAEPAPQPPAEPPSSPSDANSDNPL